MYNLAIRMYKYPPLLTKRLKIYLAGDRTPDPLNQKQTCYHLNQINLKVWWSIPFQAFSIKLLYLSKKSSRDSERVK